MDFGDGDSLLWSVVFGVIGTGYAMYGKKLQRGIPLACGLGLMVMPYFISGLMPMVAIGVVLCVLPFLGR
jgi:hypothetical protein